MYIKTTHTVYLYHLSIERKDRLIDE